jgi:hypothetical protein
MQFERNGAALLLGVVRNLPGASCDDETSRRGSRSRDRCLRKSHVARERRGSLLGMSPIAHEYCGAVMLALPHALSLDGHPDSVSDEFFGAAIFLLVYVLYRSERELPFGVSLGGCS